MQRSISLLVFVRLLFGGVFNLIGWAKPIFVPWCVRTPVATEKLFHKWLSTLTMNECVFHPERRRRIAVKYHNLNILEFFPNTFKKGIEL